MRNKPYTGRFFYCPPSHPMVPPYFEEKCPNSTLMQGNGFRRLKTTIFGWSSKRIFLPKNMWQPKLFYLSVPNPTSFVSRKVLCIMYNYSSSPLSNALKNEVDLPHTFIGWQMWLVNQSKLTMKLEWTCDQNWLQSLPLSTDIVQKRRPKAVL